MNGILYISWPFPKHTVFMVEILLIAVVALYVLELLLFRKGLTISSKIRPREGYEPTVSIIIAARNEENQILTCLQSLTSIDYPAEKLEIVIVDDFSTDRTAEVVEQFLAGMSNMRLLKSPPESGNLRGKTNAIAQGIRHTTGEIIMSTDADCSVSPGWVRGTVKYFHEDTGIVGGFTILTSHNVFHGVQALDWLYLFSIASATAGLKIPLTAIGNNLSIRRAAYLETGGYEVIPFSVTEDYSLVQTIIQKTRYGLSFPLEPHAIVTSGACDSLSQLIRQKQRWGVGALDMIPSGMLIVALGWFARLSVVAGFAFMPIQLSLGGLGAIVLADYIFLSRVFGLLPFKHVRKHFPAFEAYLTFYGLIIPFLTLGSRNVIWKERTLRREKKNAFR
jgi:cellulose synthase/poly-beta-1,6-N-acetylglucosamine synthase-like glycosyltransferase